MPKMARLGTDLIYAGLGIGAIYLVYKATSGVTKVSDSIGEVGESAGNLTTSILDNTRAQVEIAFAGVTEFEKRIGGLLSNITVTKNQVSNPQSAAQTKAAVGVAQTTSFINKSLPNDVPKLPLPSTINYVKTGSFGLSNPVINLPSNPPVGEKLRDSIFYKNTQQAANTQATTKVVDTKKADIFKKEYEKTMGRK